MLSAEAAEDRAALHRPLDKDNEISSARTSHCFGRVYAFGMVPFRFLRACVSVAAAVVVLSAHTQVPEAAPAAPQNRVVRNTTPSGPDAAASALYYFDDGTPGAHGHALDSRALGQQFRYTFTGAGRNENGSTVSQWSVGKGDVSYMDVYATGIHQMHSAFTNVYATGDNTWQYAYCKTAGGITDGSGEGAKCLSVQQLEDYGDYRGRVRQGSEGDGLNEIHTDATDNPGTEGPRRMLLNLSQELSSGHVLQKSLFQGSQLVVAELDTPVTPSPWIGQMSGRDVLPAVDMTSPKVVTLPFTTLQGRPMEGAHACLAPAWGQPEELVMSHVVVSGTSVSVDLAPRHGIHDGAYLFQGPCSAFDSEELRPHAGPHVWRDTTYVLGYTDDHHAVLGFYAKGSRQSYPGGLEQAACAVRNIKRDSSGLAVAVMDFEGCIRMAVGNTSAVLTGTDDMDGPLTASPMYSVTRPGLWEVRWQTNKHTATTRLQNGVLHFGNQDGAFHIYAMAMTDNTCDPQVNAAPTFTAPHPCINGYFHLETNSVHWHAGDNVELPHYMAIRSGAGYFVAEQETPNFQTVPLSILAGGRGVGDGPMIAMRVDTPAHEFLGDGGPVIAAPLGIRFEGPNSGLIRALAPQGPAGVAIHLDCPEFADHSDCSRTPGYFVFSLAGVAGPHAGGIRFSPATSDMEVFARGGVQVGDAFRLKYAPDDRPLRLAGDMAFRTDRIGAVSGRIRYLGAEQTPAAHTVATLDDLPLAAVSPVMGGSPLAAGICVTAAVPMPGVTTDMVVEASPANGVDPGDGFFVRALATAVDKAAVKVCALVPGTPARTSYNLRAIR